MSTHYVWVNDSLIPADNAQVNISDLAVQRGYGIFDFCIKDNNRINALSNAAQDGYKKGSVK